MFFLFFITCTTIYAIKRIAIFFQAPFPLCLLLFLSHSAVVRDFSQIRVGFAVALFIIGLTAKVRAIKCILYIFATLVHATILVAIIGYEVCQHIANLNKRRHRILLLIVINLFVVIIGQNLNNFYFIDDRVEIYLNWLSIGYGLPVNSYYQIYLHVGILLIHLLLSKKLTSIRLQLRSLVYLECLGIVFFIAFSGVAIFAYRITNVVTCLYFVLIAKSLSEFYLSKNTSIINRWISFALGCGIILLLLTRPGTSEILGEISF
jgi:hypothetical protein